MEIQFTNSTMTGDYKVLKNEEMEKQNLFHLRLDEEENKKQKPRLEIRHEGGYIRKYVVKANGDKILIMEMKQKDNVDGSAENESGDLVDQAQDGLMKQLELFSGQIKERDKMVSTWDKKSGLTKYKTGI